MMRETFKYYYGTDGSGDVFAVANADEIPASCMNIRELQARNQQEAFDAAMQIHRDHVRETGK